MKLGVSVSLGFMTLWSALLILSLWRIPDIRGELPNQQIYKDHPVSFEITPSANKINLIKFFLKNVSLRNKDKMLLRIDNTQEVREVIISGINIGDGEMVPFKFAPLPVLNGQKLNIILSAPESTYENAISVYSYEVFAKGDVQSIMLNLAQFYKQNLSTPRLYITVLIVLGLSFGLGQKVSTTRQASVPSGK